MQLKAVEGGAVGNRMRGGLRGGKTVLVKVRIGLKMVFYTILKYLIVVNNKYQYGIIF